MGFHFTPFTYIPTEIYITHGTHLLAFHNNGIKQILRWKKKGIQLLASCFRHWGLGTESSINHRRGGGHWNFHASFRKHFRWKRLSVDAPPALCPPCQYSCPIDLLTLTFHASQQLIYTGHFIWNLENHVFHPDDLDLWPCLSNSSKICSRNTSLPHLVYVGQIVQPVECLLTDGQMDRQTDGTDFIPSTADAGGKNILDAD